MFALQDKIIYLTTTSILVVAGFGIFNVISTIVLGEGARHRDHALDWDCPAPTSWRFSWSKGSPSGLPGVTARLACGLGTRPRPARGSGANRQCEATGSRGRLTPILFTTASLIALPLGGSHGVAAHRDRPPPHQSAVDACSGTA